MNSSKTVWNKINHNLDHSSLIFSFPGGANGEEPICQCRRLKRHGFNPWTGRSLGRGHGDPLQYSCQENPVNRGAGQAIVHRVAKSQTHLKWLSMGQISNVADLKKKKQKTKKTAAKYWRGGRLMILKTDRPEFESWLCQLSVISNIPCYLTMLATWSPLN